MPIISNSRGVGSPGGPDDAIQFKSGTDITGESDLRWDATKNQMNLKDLKIDGLVGPVVLNDNTGSFTTFLTLSALEYNVIDLDIMIVRDGERQKSKINITHDGIAATATEESEGTLLGGLGVEFDVVLSGSNILVQYKTTATGFNASVKYTVKGWL